MSRTRPCSIRTVGIGGILPREISERGFLVRRMIGLLGDNTERELRGNFCHYYAFFLSPDVMDLANSSSRGIVLCPAFRCQWHLVTPFGRYGCRQPRRFRSGIIPGYKILEVNGERKWHFVTNVADRCGLKVVRLSSYFPARKGAANTKSG